MADHAASTVILVAAQQQDLTADLIVERLSRRKVAFSRLNVDRLLLDVFIETADDNSTFVDEAGAICELDDVSAILYRNHEIPASSDGVSPAENAFAGREALGQFFGSLFTTRALWVNHPAMNWRASQKVWQLRIARELGLETPRTLVTRRPDSARRFLRALAGNAIAKPVTYGTFGDGNDERAIFTSRIPPDLAPEAFESLALAPVILQEEIAKRSDLRVTVVGPAVVAVRIDSQSAPQTVTDWRVPGASPLQHTVVELPSALAEKCVALTRALDLVFGAIDLVEGVDGTFYFLEINPAGQWGWLELEAGAEIAERIVDVLVAGHG